MRPGHAGGIRCFLTGEEDDNYLRAFVRPLSPTLCRLRHEALEIAAEEVVGEVAEAQEANLMFEDEPE